MHFLLSKTWATVDELVLITLLQVVKSFLDHNSAIAQSTEVVASAAAASPDAERCKKDAKFILHLQSWRFTLHL